MDSDTALLRQPKAAHDLRQGWWAHGPREARCDEPAQVRQPPTGGLAPLRVGTTQDVVRQHRGPDQPQAGCKSRLTPQAAPLELGFVLRPLSSTLHVS